MNRFGLGVLLVVLSAVGFGVMPVLAQYAYAGGASVQAVLVVRFFVAALCFFAVILWRERKFTLPSAKQAGALFLLGGVFYFLQSNFYFTSVQYIAAPLAALLFYTYPVFVALLAVFVERESLHVRTWIAIGASFVGLGLVLGTSFADVNVVGVLLILGAAVVYSLYISVGNRVVKALPSLLTSAFVVLFAAVSNVGLGAVRGTLDFDFTPTAWWAILGIGLLSTVVAIFTFFKGMELIGSTRASIVSMLEPLTTIVFSAVLFGQHLSASQWVGGMIVLGGALLVILGQGTADAKVDEKNLSA